MVRSSAALRLASWIGRQGKGSVVLRFHDARLVLHINDGHITAVEGSDGEILTSAFGLPPEGEWFAEARTAVSQNLVTPEEAAAVLKRAVTTQLLAFFQDENADLEVFPGEPRPASGFVISYPHIVYELVLSQGGEPLLETFLPDTSAVLKRLPAFNARVKELDLPQEALAILAKVNDHRSAEAVAEPSPHGRDLVLRLLAATVGAGLVELQFPSLEDVPLETEEQSGRRKKRRRFWPWLLVLLLVVFVAVAVFVTSSKGRTAIGSAGDPWAIAVGGACAPAELEQLYRLQAKSRDSLRVVPLGKELDQCFRLVWGAFPRREDAEAAMKAVPPQVVQPGFIPHVLLLESASP